VADHLKVLDKLSLKMFHGLSFENFVALSCFLIEFGSDFVALFCFFYFFVLELHTSNFLLEICVIAAYDMYSVADF